MCFWISPSIMTLVLQWWDNGLHYQLSRILVWVKSRWQCEFVFQLIIFRRNKWLQNLILYSPLDLVHNWNNFWWQNLIISPTDNLIVLHECKQIMLSRQNNGQNQILEWLVCYIHIVNLNQAKVMNNQRPHKSYLCNYSLRENQVQKQMQLVWKPLKLLSTEFSHDILRTAKFQVKSSI